MMTQRKKIVSLRGYLSNVFVNSSESFCFLVYLWNNICYKLFTDNKKIKNKKGLFKDYSSIVLLSSCDYFLLFVV